MALRIELFVTDPERSLQFYSDVLGFKIAGGDPHHRLLCRGDARIAIEDAAQLVAGHPFRPEIASDRKGLGVEIVLAVDDVELLYRHVQHTGYPIREELTTRPWGLIDFRLLDPDGYYLRLTSREPRPAVRGME